MASPQPDLSPQAAAAALAWLVEMGADEVLLEQPVNRLAALPQAPPIVTPVVPRPIPQVQRQDPAVPPPPRWQAAADPSVLMAEARERADACQNLDQLQQALRDFNNHPLKKTAGNLCFLSGARQSRILLLCDKPRSEEDRTGEVLAAKHQVLAERMLASVGLCGMAEADGAEQVTMANVIPWRPPGNRAPTELETSLCLPFAQRLILLLQPKVILCFGALPGLLLAGGEESIPKARGKWLSVPTDSGDIPLITTFHPETLLKSPGSKRLAWHDLLAFRAKLESA